MQYKVLILILLQIITGSVISVRRYSLKQVLILSRHGVRTPLAKNLGELTPKPWPTWNERAGFLTQKGAKLEGFMGKYFASWLIEQKLLPYGCPVVKDVYVYANIKQRTKASAKAFVENAFPGCNVIVHHNDAEEIDPVFNPVIHNSTVVFKKIAKQQMQELLRSLHLNKSYENIDLILDYKDSNMCKKNKKCDLTTDVNKIINLQQGLKPNVAGPLKISNSVIDAFVMQFYEGFPIEDVAWGTLTDDGQWETIMELSRGYHGVIFNTSLIARDISAPLVKYMSDIFMNVKVSPKVILLMGHDANLYTVLNGMNFKSYSLANQTEITPVGGKLVFQRWFDAKYERDLLKVEFVYQTTEQLRESVELSLTKPPGSKLMELNGCRVDEEGFCLWSDFIDLLKVLISNTC